MQNDVTIVPGLRLQKIQVLLPDLDLDQSFVVYDACIFLILVK